MQYNSQPQKFLSDGESPSETSTYGVQQHQHFLIAVTLIYVPF